MTIEIATPSPSAAPVLGVRLRVVTVRALFESIARSTANKLSQELFWEADDENRPLFRIDTVERWNRTMQQLTVQWVGMSDPDMTLIHGREIYCSSTVLQIDPGSVWSFETLAYPTSHKAPTMDPATGRRTRGKRVVIAKDQDQRDWLKKRTPECELKIRHFRPLTLEDAHHRDRYRCIEASGTIVADQPKELEQVLSHGIGSGKHAGLGMVKIRPIGMQE